ncbi:hypothetical protein DMENIID0001_066700 [Sergentomyia squamirostris]
MRSLLIFVVIVASVAVISAYPSASSIETEGFNINPLDEAYSGKIEPRMKRFTCDFLSLFGIINHSACAAHCNLKGYAGGYCNEQAVCKCRE